MFNCEITVQVTKKLDEFKMILNSPILDAKGSAFFSDNNTLGNQEKDIEHI